MAKKPTYEELEKNVDRLTSALDETEGRCLKLKREIKGQQQVQNIILDSVPAAIFFKDKDHKIIRVNKTFADNLGCGRDEIEGKNMFDFFSEEDYPSWKDDLEIIMSGKPIKNFLEQVETQYGPKWFEVDKIPYIDKEGQLSGVVGFGIDVTEKKKTQEALRKSEKRYRKIFDMAEAFIWELDYSELKQYMDELKSQGIVDLRKYIDETPDFLIKASGMINFMDVNESAVRLQGLSSKKELLDHAMPLMLEQGAEVFKESMIAIAEGKTLYEAESKVITLKGESVDLLVRISVPEENEEFKNLLVTSLDVTRLKKAETALENERNLLRESEQKYREILDNMEDLYMEADLAGNVRFSNKAGIKKIGYPDNELIGMNYREFLVPETAEGVFEQFNEIFNTGRPKRINWDIITKNRENLYFESIVTLLKDKNDQIIGFRGLARDITEKKKLEASLRKSEDKYLNILDNMEDLYAEFDLAGNYIFFNKATQKAMGYTDDELMNLNYKEVVDDKTAKRLYTEFHDLFLTGNPKVIEWEYYPKDKKNTVSAEGIVTLIKDDSDNPIGFRNFARDVTFRKIAEEAMKKAKEEAEHANAAKSEFLANMSHEIRTPMNAILGFTDLLIPMVIDAKQKNYLESIQSSGKNLLTLINDILDLSKIEAGKLDLQYESVNPHSIFKEIKQIFSLKINEKNLEFVIDIAPDIPDALLLDEVRLRQILFNLIGNSVKFTKKGYIKLSAKKEYTEKNLSHLDLIIVVEDTGSGIPSESLEMVFDAFKQQDGQSTKEFGGTGLGLSITKRLVEMMEGSISVKSQVDKGTSFEIILQQVSVAATRSDEKTNDRLFDECILFEAARILVVDDIAENRFLINEFFENTAIQTIEAVNGEKAISAAKQFKPDAIIMDIRMPVMDGYEATQRIKEDKDLKNIPVIALTASGMQADREKITQSGFDGFLTKPVNKLQIFNELANFLNHSKKEKPKHSEQPAEISGQIEMLESISPETYGKLPVIIDHLMAPPEHRE